jgi:hypothetical protein
MMMPHALGSDRCFVAEAGVVVFGMVVGSLLIPPT